MIKLATWNVNSVKARLGHLTQWLETAKPDIVCLQELKCQAEDFPALEVKALGYFAEVAGQKTYNGVAILSREKATDVVRALPGDKSDEQARYIEATIGGLRVA
ncbi:MAG: endonuclease/exonuclease/phosphatase family protein, partial [Stellaceae bacterium]